MADYATYGAKWQGPTVSWYYSGDERFRADIQRAMDRWDALIDIDFVHANSAAEADINIGFEHMDGAYGQLGYAEGPAYSSDGTNFYFNGDTRIRFDSAETWTWSNAAGGYVMATGVTFYELALHEIGHALGLDHSTNYGAIMYPNIGGSATDITHWDEAGIRTLYAPETGAPPPPPAADNSAPVATVDDLWVRTGEWTSLSSVASIWDPDGDTIVEYELWNGDGQGQTWWADGNYVDASNGYRTSDLSGITFRAMDTPGTQNLWIRAYDGKDWGAWDQFTITTYDGNRAPVAKVEDQWRPTGEWTSLADVASIWDPDGDSITRYEIWNEAGNNNTWWAAGHYVDASNGYQTSDLGSITFRAQDYATETKLWVRAFDGTNWGEWDEFSVFSYSEFQGGALGPNNTVTGNNDANAIAGSAADDILLGEGGNDRLIGGRGNDWLNGGEHVDTAIFSGWRTDYTIIRNPDNDLVVVDGPDGYDTLSSIERLQFNDGIFNLARGHGQYIDVFNAAPNSFMWQIRDFDGNDLGASDQWHRLGSVDIEGDGDTEVLFVNTALGRWASVGIADDGQIYMNNNSWGGDTRVVGTYVDPLIASGDVQAGGEFDSQLRFQNDLWNNNIGQILGAGDYNNDGLQEIYFRLADGSAYLHAYMHEDGNIQYANYQAQWQVVEYLSAYGHAESTWAGWF